MKRTNNILWGIVLIIIGLIISLNTLEITNINIFFDGWWTLFIIVPSFIDLLTTKSKTGSLIGITIGIFLLLACQELIDFTLILKLIFPVIMIIIGLSLIFKDTINRKIKQEIKKLDQKQKNEYYSTFESKKLEIEELDNTELNAIFGELSLDLTKSKIKKDTIINANAIFGSIKIYTNEEVNIKIISTPIFGGISNEIKNKNDNKVTVYINATAVFGGIKIK